jgi:hypothetical protein
LPYTKPFFMKIPARFISLTLLLLLITPATAQPMAGAEQPTPRSWDTILFRLPLHNFYNDDPIPGLGKVFHPTISYTIVQSGNSLMARKEVEHFVDDGARPVTDTSDWLYIRNDTLANWIDQHATTIKEESIAPFIYRWESKGLTNYSERWGFHTDIFLIVLITAGEEVRKPLDMIRLEKDAHEGRTVNLNYNYNTSTKLYQLFRQLDKCTQAWDQQFVFPGKQRSIHTSPAQGNMLELRFKAWDTRYIFSKKGE